MHAGKHRPGQKRLSRVGGQASIRHRPRSLSEPDTHSINERQRANISNLARSLMTPKGRVACIDEGRRLVNKGQRRPSIFASLAALKGLAPNRSVGSLARRTKREPAQLLCYCSAWRTRLSPTHLSHRVKRDVGVISQVFVWRAPPANERAGDATSSRHIAGLADNDDGDDDDEEHEKGSNSLSQVAAVTRLGNTIGSRYPEIRKGRASFWRQPCALTSGTKAYLSYVCRKRRCHHVHRLVGANAKIRSKPLAS